MQTMKSYVLRAGRTSPRQQYALDNHLAKYLLPVNGSLWDFTLIFGRNADTIVEIGFGMGASLLTMAQNAPHKNFIGIEVHQAGLGSLAADLYENNITNVRIVSHDAVAVLQSAIGDDALAGVQIFFPDPWPKKRHHKRRLIQQNFVALVVKKLHAGGYIHCATDWEEYALQILDVCNLQQSLFNTNVEGGFIMRPDTRPITKFERRGLKLGHGVYDILFTMVAPRERYL